MYKRGRAARMPPARAGGCTLIDLGEPSTGAERVAVARKRSRRRRGLWAVLRNAAALQIDGCACRRRARRLALSQSSCLRAATRWQERAKMTEVSQNAPPWTAGGLPRTAPSSLSPGAARRAGRPHDASRPARAPASSSWRGGVRQTTGRAWLAARADRTPTSSQRLGAARFPRRAAPTSTTSTASGLRADRAIVTSARQRPWPWAGACPGAAPPP